jgi:hypothetical protein
MERPETVRDDLSRVLFLTGVASGTTGIMQVGPETEAKMQAWAKENARIRELLKAYWPTIPYKTVPD